jgi:hypothetical protein
MHGRRVGDMVPPRDTWSEPGGSGMQVEKLTALEAHRAGKLYLPPGYGVQYGADVLLLRRDDGSVVAAFSARGLTPSEVTRTAEADYRTYGKSSA